MSAVSGRSSVAVDSVHAADEDAPRQGDRAAAILVIVWIALVAAAYFGGTLWCFLTR